jgi:hypothetical protein
VLSAFSLLALAIPAQSAATSVKPEPVGQALSPYAAYFLIPEIIPPELWGSQSWLQRAFSRTSELRSDGKLK